MLQNLSRGPTFFGILGALLLIPAVRDRVVEGRVPSVYRWGGSGLLVLVVTLSLIPALV